MARYRFINIPAHVRVIDGRYKGREGEVWYRTDGLLFILTADGYHFFTQSNNTEATSFRRRRVEIEET